MKRATSPHSAISEANDSFQRFAWRAERFGWVIFLLFLAAALLGFTGSGPLNTATIRTNALDITYSPFARQLTQTQWKIEAEHTGQDTVHIWIDRGLLDKYQLLTAVPEPAEVIAHDTRIEYIFNGTNNPTSVVFSLEPNGPGYMQGSIDAGTGNKAVISQFVYP